MALLVETARNMKSFKGFEVKEVMAKPSCRVKRLPEHTYENFEGDLGKYHQ